jgi:hypothetical protein
MDRKSSPTNLIPEKENLPMKYILGVWKTLPEYPTHQDVIYEMLTYAGKKNGLTKQDLDKLWPDTDECKKDKLSMVEDLVRDGAIEVSENKYVVLNFL